MTTLGKPLNFNKLQALNLVIQNLGTPPSSPVVGQVYFDTNAAFLCGRIWDGTAWYVNNPLKVTDGTFPMAKLVTDPLARANHTGTQLASTVSNFDAQVRTSRLDQMAVPTAVVAFGGQVLQNIAAGTLSTDGVNLAQVQGIADAVRQGSRVKDAVTYLATGNIALTGFGVQGGGDWASALTAGQTVLAVGQTDPRQNGPYLASSGTWTRRVADDQQAELVPGALWFVALGTTYAASSWVLRNVIAPLPGTDNVTLTQSGASTSYSAGNGIDVTGSVISAKVFASSGVLLSGSGISVDTSIVVRKFAQTFGDGTSTVFSFTHNLGTLDLTFAIRRVSDGELIMADLVPTATNTASLTLAVVPTASEYRITVHG